MCGPEFGAHLRQQYHEYGRIIREANIESAVILVFRGSCLEANLTSRRCGTSRDLGLVFALDQGARSRTGAVVRPTISAIKA